jgi:hypothetical protein
MDTSPIEDSKKDLLLTVANDMERAYLSQNQNLDSSPPVYNQDNAPQVGYSNYPGSHQINPPSGYTGLNEQPSINSTPLITQFQEPYINAPINDPALLIPQYPAMNCCDHMRLKLKLEIESGQACICVSCVVMGLVGLILFIAAALRSANNNSNNSRSNYSGGHYHNHWLFIYGGYNQDFIEKRRVLASNESDDVISCCCGCVYPHRYKIICDDCNGTLKEGTKSGSLASAICFGIFGISMGVLGIYLLTLIR